MKKRSVPHFFVLVICQWWCKNSQSYRTLSGECTETELYIWGLGDDNKTENRSTCLAVNYLNISPPPGPSITLVYMYHGATHFYMLYTSIFSKANRIIFTHFFCNRTKGFTIIMIMIITKIVLFIYACILQSGRITIYW